MNTTGKVFTACGLGAFIGTMVALQLGHLFWWVGMLVGGFVRYMSYEFKSVISSIPKAYKAVKKSNWKPDTNDLSTATTVILVILNVAVLIAIFMLLVKLKKISHPAWLILIMFSFFGVFVSNIAIATESKNTTPREIFKRINPITYYFYLVPKWAAWIMPSRVPRLISLSVRLAVKFTKHLFILIYSDKRLLCGTDAAIGTAIGYFSGNAIIGLVAGGVFGIFNYKIISQLWLKLPKTS